MESLGHSSLPLTALGRQDDDFRLKIITNYVYRGIRYQTVKGCVGGTERTRNHIGMQSRKGLGCELRCKEAEKKNSNALMGQKAFY
ncbi:hypothetical protein TNCV_3913921 [Trichonephila clavipes]|nr:hypothetical protein TNCV_3913921 [Trichonephila clavipes]